MDIIQRVLDLKKVKYNLYCVIFQRGGAMGGHYWCFIKDFELGLWRKYNDRIVSLVEDPAIEIFEQKTNDTTATPYFLVYVKDEMEQDLTQAVFRQIPPEEEAGGDVPDIRLETPEVEMTEAAWSILEELA